jgi:hypothetical protein
MRAGVPVATLVQSQVAALLESPEYLAFVTARSKRRPSAWQAAAAVVMVTFAACAALFAPYAPAGFSMLQVRAVWISMTRLAMWRCMVQDIAPCFGMLHETPSL